MVREPEWSIVDVAMEVGMALGGTTEQWQAAGLSTPSLLELIGMGLKAF